MITINKPLTLILTFNAFFLFILVADETSRNNFGKLGATLQSAPLEFKIIINLFLIFTIFLVYLFLKYFFELDLSEHGILKKYHKRILIICLTVFCFMPAAIFIGYEYGLIDSYFRFFGVGHIKPNFVDLRGTLAAITKVNEVGEGYQIDCPNNPCIGWRWTYGSSILKLKNLGIFTESATYICAYILFIIFLYVVFRMSYNIQSSIVFLALIPTGTLMLIIERMNIDIVLIFLIYYLAHTINKNHIFLLIAPIFIFIAASVKYYPLILMVPLIVLVQSKKFRVYYGFISLAGILYIIPELKLAGIENFSYGYSATYGLKNLIGLINGNSEPTIVVNFLTFIGFLFFLYITYYIFTNYKLSTKNDQQSVSNFSLYLFGFVVLLSSWLVNSNYPYRLICVLPMVPFLVDSYKNNKEIVLTGLSCIVIFFGSIPVTLSPVRNLTLCGYIAINLGILLKVYYKREINLNFTNLNLLQTKIPKYNFRKYTSKFIRTV